MIIRNWEDLRKSGVIFKKNFFKKGMVSIVYRKNSFSCLENDLESAINVLKGLGHIVEYKTVKVINTLESWEELQKEMAESGIFYDRSFGNFFECDYEEDGEINQIIETNITIKKIEEMLNVDLLFLKGCK